MRLGVVDEGLGAVAALQEERLAAGDLAEALLEPVDRYEEAEVFFG